MVSRLPKVLILLFAFAIYLAPSAKATEPNFVEDVAKAGTTMAVAGAGFCTAYMEQQVQQVAIGIRYRSLFGEGEGMSPAFTLFRTPIHFSRFTFGIQELGLLFQRYPRNILLSKFFHAVMNHATIPLVVTFYTAESLAKKSIGIPLKLSTQLVPTSYAIRGIEAHDCLMLRAAQGRSFGDIEDLRHSGFSDEVKTRMALTSLGITALIAVQKGYVLMDLCHMVGTALKWSPSFVSLFEKTIFATSTLLTVSFDSDHIVRYLYGMYNEPYVMCTASIQVVFAALLFKKLNKVGFQTMSAGYSFMFFEMIIDAVSTRHYYSRLAEKITGGVSYVWGFFAGRE